MISLTATPAAGMGFAGWGGCTTSDGIGMAPIYKVCVHQETDVVACFGRVLIMIGDVAQVEGQSGS